MKGINHESQQPVLIGLFNISERSKVAIEMVLKRGGGHHRVVEHLAQVAIVDIDGGNSAEMWQKFRQRFPVQPAIVLSVIEQNISDALWVKKPVNPDLLIEAITQVARQVHLQLNKKEVAAIKPDEALVPELIKEVAPIKPDAVLLPVPIEAELPDKTVKSSPDASQNNPRQNKSKSEVQTLDVISAMEDEALRDLCGSQLDINPSNTKQLAQLFYPPEDYIQGLLFDTFRAAQADGKPRVIKGVVEAILIFPEKPDGIMTKLSERRLRSICAIQLGTLYKISVRELLPRKRPILLPKVSHESFFWTIALASARGRLPKGTDLRAPVKLQRWPNFTRVQITPHAMQIAALWITQPMGLLETALQLGIPQRYVFPFYSAANAIGIAFAETSFAGAGTHYVAEHQHTNQSPLPLGKTDERRGFLARMLARLKQE